MKKNVVALAALGAFATLAHAQSSVTLYGVIDEGFDFTSNVGGARAYQLSSGVLQGSRFGFKGTEDLGGGVAAIFQLENGFDLNNGTLKQGGREFGRQAYVGLSSNAAGTLTAGRQYDSVVDYLAPLTANGNWGGALFSHPLDNDNTDNSFRINNSVKYASPNLGGFRFGGLYGASNEAGSLSDNRAWSVGTSYNNGPFALGAAFLDIKHPGRTTTGAVTSDATFDAGWERVAGIGANYAVGPATLGAVFSYTNVHNVSGSFATLIFKNYELNAKYMLTPAFSLGAMYDYTSVRGSSAGSASKGHWNEGGLMADYFLSKRTDVYAQTVYQQGSGIAGADISGSAGASSNHHQTVARVGLRHKF
ncbi:porin [Paraburkholderia sp. BR14263]|uniref:porin n=1 Tax=unclassified Paraburkholderia TaxID=2615204 RepID=UPI0034CD13EC